MATLTPVDHDPFASPDDSVGGGERASSLVPVDYDPFAKPAPPPKPPSVAATALHAAEHAAVPTAAGLVGFGPGFAGGMAAGALTGPLAPVASPVLGVLGGAATAYLGSRVARAVQDVVTAQIPESTKKYFGQDVATQQAEQEAHPWVAEYTPDVLNLAAMRPGAVVNVAREAAGPIERFATNQLAGRAPTAALMGAQTAGIEAAEGQPLDWQEIGKSAVIGGALNKPTKFGERAMEAGAAPVHATLGAMGIHDYPGAPERPAPAAVTTPEAEIIPPQRALPPPETTYGEGFTMRPAGAPPAPAATTIDIGTGRYTINPNPGGGFDIDAGPLGIFYANTYEAAVNHARAFERGTERSQPPVETPPALPKPEEDAAAAERAKLASVSQPAPEPTAPAAPPPAPPAVTPAGEDLAKVQAAAEADAQRPAGTPAEQAGQLTPPVRRTTATEPTEPQPASEATVEPAPPGAETNVPRESPVPTPPARPRAPVDDWADQIVAAYREGGVDAALAARSRVGAENKITNATNAVLNDRLRNLFTPEEQDDIRRTVDARARPPQQESAQPPERPPVESSRAAEPPPPPPLSAEDRNAVHDPQEIGRQINKARDATLDGKKGHVNYHGVDFVVETPAGETRSGRDARGERWESEMPRDLDYGYIGRTRGADDEHVDAYLSSRGDLNSRQAFVIDQINPDTGAFDEHKVMLGFATWAQARGAYEDAFSDGRGGERIGNVTPMSLDALKQWLKEGDTKNPIGQGAFGLAPPATEPPTTPSPSPAVERPGDYGTKNKLFTADAAAAARERLRQKMSGTTLNAGIDPTLLADVFTIGGYHVEAGIHKFADFVKAMVDDLGDWTRPFLPHVYGMLRDYPGFEAAREMSTPEEVARHLAEQPAELQPEAPGTTSTGSAEGEHGLQGAVPAGDAGSRPEDVQQPGAGGETGGTPPGQERGSARPPEAAPGEAPGPELAATPGGGGTGVLDTDRVPPGQPEGSNIIRFPGTAGRPTDTSGEPGTRGEPPRAPDAEVKGTNYRVEPGALEEARSPRIKARDNIAAIELAKRLIAEGRPATREEQAVLAKYVGWGGLSGVFPDSTGTMRKGFEGLGGQLKDILTAKEYKAAAESTQYAHYTSENVIRNMWDAVDRMGFKGGSVLEPGMGVGHFLGLMPPDLAAKSRYQGIEVDPLTAQIAKLLYPESGVREADFIRTPMPEDTFDLVIGNPPFSDTVIRGDRKYAARGFMLHDYFFAKSIDSVRPGGLLGFITSAGTMNKMDEAARRYLAERAEFVGGVRLPDTAFKQNAGTEVTTDILFFKKNPFGRQNLGDVKPAWTETVTRNLPHRDGGMADGQVNRYFSEHPEQVLGQEGFFDTLRATARYAVHATPGADLGQQLSEALERLPRDVMEPEPTPQEKAELDFQSGQTKDGSFYVGPDGALMQYSGGVGRPVARRGKGVTGGYTADEMAMIRQVVPIRDALRDVFRHDLAENAEAATEARSRLNRVYDDFVAKNGPINKAVINVRRPSRVQQETARNDAREEAREMGEDFHEGDFDPSELIKRGAKAAEIAAARDAARERAKAMGREWDEGSFDPDDMADIAIVKRPNIDPFEADQESYRLRAIEDYDDSTGTASKRRIFRESVLTRETEPQINSANDGVLWSLNKFGRLNVDEIAGKLGTSRDQVINDLGDAIYRVPGTDDTHQVRDQYLSGDVVTKLEEARAAAELDPSVRRNVEALERVQPAPLSPAEIAVNLGMPWIPANVVRRFMTDHLNIGTTRISYAPALGKWFVDSRNAAFGPGQAEWGAGGVSAHNLLANALNKITPKIYFEDSDGKKVFDPVATQAAQDKIDAMKQAFARWVAADPALSDQLADLYNSKFNRVVLREWNGDYLTTPGVSADWSWRPHQTRVIARIVQDGNTYMAHAVGAGKTSAMIGAGMEMRRLGLVSKPMYVVPNHMLGQFAKEFYEQYPTARIAVADDTRFHTSRRKQFMADVSQQDLDAVIITNSSFGKLPISREFGDQLIQEQIDELEEALRATGDRITVKDMKNRLKKLQEKLDKPVEAQDQVLNFEEMGVDFMFVDEAHQFRKLSYTTQQRVKGINPTGSAMSWDLYGKVRYLDSRQPGRSIVMASGTPVTNTMGELYTLSRYMQPAALAERGLSHFDAWSGAFGDSVTRLEQTATGAYEPVTRFSKFINIPELYKMVGSVMDVVTEGQLSQYVTRPELKGGARQFHLAPRTPFLDAFQQHLGTRVEAIRAHTGRPYPGMDILLSVINDGRLGAIDPRFIDPRLPSDPNSKLNMMIDNVHRIWEETKDKPFYQPGTTNEVARGPAAQMIFSNLGIQGRDGGFSGYQWMRREFIRRGIPADEIAFIRDYNTPVAKQRLFNDVNEGKIRILIGSTAKMGTGVNAQKRLYAIHNLDPLWFPADDTQRNGRGLRQGNLNPEIEIHDYSTKGTYDATMWDMMGRKGRFIEQFFRGDPTLRNMEDFGEASQYEQAAAMSTSDERVIHLTEMKQALEKMERRRLAHEAEQYSLRNNARNEQSRIEYHQERIGQVGQDIATRQDTRGDKFVMTIGDATFKDRAEAAEALMKTVDEVFPNLVRGQSQPIASLGGFQLFVERGNSTSPDAKPMFSFEHASPDRTDLHSDGSAAGVIRSFEAKLRGFEGDREWYGKQLADSRAKLAAAQGQIGKPFEGGGEMEPLRRQIDELEATLRRESEEAKFNWEPFRNQLRNDLTAPGPLNRKYMIERRPQGDFALYHEDPGSPAELEATGKFEDLVNLPGTRRPGAREDDFGTAREQGVEDADEGPVRPLVDQLDNYRAYAAREGASRGDASVHHTARAWVMDQGGTKHEYLAVWDPKTGQIEYAATRHMVDRTTLPPEAIERAATDPDAGLIVHHNHPYSTATSPGDIKMLGALGIDRMIAHGANGAYSEAQLSTPARAWLGALGFDDGINKWQELVQGVASAIQPRLERLAQNRRISWEQANALYGDLVARALETGGAINYVSSHRPGANINEAYARHIIREAAIAVRQKLPVDHFPNRSPQETAQIFNRSTRTVLPEDGVGGLPQARGSVAEGGPGRLVGDVGDRGNQEGPGAEDPPGGSPEVGDLEEARPFRPPPAGAPDKAQRDDDADRIFAMNDPEAFNPRKWATSVIAKANKDTARRIQAYVQDRLAGLEAQEKAKNLKDPGKLLPAAESPTAAARLASNSASVVDYAVNHGQVRYNPATGVAEQVPGAPSLRAVLDPGRRAGPQALRDFFLWKAVNRGERLMGEGRENLIPQEVIDRNKNLDQLYQRADGTNLFHEMDAQLKGWFKNLLDFGEATGIVNPDSRALFDHDDYLPFYRQLREETLGGPSGAGGLANVRSPIKRLKGGEAKINNPVENIVTNAAAMIRRGMVNEMWNRMVDHLDGTDALTVTTPAVRVDFGDPAVQQHVRDLGLNPAALSAKQKEAAKGLWASLKQNDPDIHAFLRGGKPVYVRINDDLLARAVQSVGPQGMGVLTQILAGPARLLRSAVIFDPAFVAAHNIRQAIQAYVLHGVTPFAAIGATLRQTKGLDPVAQKLMAAGVMSGRYDIDVPRRVRAEIMSPEYQNSLINTPLKGLKLLRQLSENAMRASDIGPRVAVYEKALREGASEAEAIDQARDLLDFSKHGYGQIAMLLAQTIPFLNARWQGIARAGKGLSGPDRNAILARGALITAATLALWAMNKDDPEYQRKEDWDKQYAWQIKVGPGLWVRIPKNWEFGGLFGTLPEIIADYLDNGDMRQAQNAGLAMMLNIFKFNPIPAALKPGIEAYFNTDTFTGRPIINEAEQKKMPSDRYGPNTSPSVVAATQAYNSVVPGAMQVAPDMAEHLMRGYLAGWGGYIAAAADWLGSMAGGLAEKPTPRLTDYPVLSRFLHEEPSTSNRVLTDFYSMREQIDQIGASIKSARDAGDAARVKYLMSEHPEWSPALQAQLNAAGKQLADRRSALQKQRKNPLLTADGQRDAIDKFNAWSTQFSDHLKPLLRRAEGLSPQ